MSKIVILSGSPREKGNTMTLVNALIGALENRGHTVVHYNATTHNVIGCRACEACFNKGDACVFDEGGFNSIASDIEVADASCLQARSIFTDCRRN